MNTAEVATINHIGGRDENQDASGNFVDPATGATLAVVADGMGGHAEGRLAAQLAIEAAGKVWASRGEQTPEQLLSKLIESAHEAIRHAGEQRKIDMRAVVAALWLSPRRAVSIHAGDCRVSQFGPNGFVGRTIDHSIAQFNVLRGKLSEADIAAHPDQSRLITYIGGDEEPDPEITEWSLEDGCNFILSSDGFWGLFTPEEQHALLASKDLQSALESAVTDKLEAAAEDHDNTTAILIRRSASPATAAIVAPRYRRMLGLGSLLVATLVAAILLQRGLSPSGTDGTPDTPAVPEPRLSEQLVPEKKEVPPFPPDAVLDKDTSGELPLDGERTVQGEKVEQPTRRGERFEFPQIALPVPADGEVAAVLTDWLREQGVLGETDVLMVDGEVKNESGALSASFDQHHGDLPVYEGQVFVVVEGGRIVSVSGRLHGEIVLPETSPLAYEEALAAAAEALSESVEPQGAARLWVVQRSDDTFTRAWAGDVTASSGQHPERWWIDAHEGLLLRRVPLLPDHPSR